MRAIYHRAKLASVNEQRLAAPVAELAIRLGARKEPEVPIAPGPDRMFSPASVAKSYLEELHIVHPSHKVADAEAAYGIFMQSYFGGRAESPPGESPRPTQAPE